MDLEKALKKAKVKQILKTIGLIILITPLLLGLVYLGGNTLSKRQSDSLNESLFNYHAIAAPNVQIDSQVLRKNSYLGGEMVTHRSKDIEGYLVPWSTLTSSYTWFSSQTDYNELVSGWQHSGEMSYEYDKQTKQKSASFYQPKITDYAIGIDNDLETVAMMKNHVAEMAISFDKTYDYDEVKKMIPENLHIVWYWADTPLKEYEEQEREGAQGIERYGFSAGTDEKETQGNYDDFREIVTNIKGKERDEEAKKLATVYEKKEKVSQVKLNGVMLTGKAENFSKLIKTDWIRGASVGVTVEEVPYLSK